MREIIIENAHENNLKNVSLRIPHYQLIAVTGVSGSGKTSLVYDVLSAEGQRLFFENFIGGRALSAQPSRPKVSLIEGLFPVISINQGMVVRSPRSTVGTLTELSDLLRLLFARLGKSDIPGLHPYRSLFSFNLPDGYCPACKGLGVQDHIDPSLLIGDGTRTIRQGAFVLTTPNNYIIYSQVTMAVLDEVCRAEGFTVDIPWQDLSVEQKNIVLNGSDKIKVLFGKHPLESRLKWTGITAKPRDEDYYKGILPVMEDILRRDRNPNIMRFARSHSCTECGGKRLNKEALSVKLWGMDISAFAEMTVSQFHSFFNDLKVIANETFVVEPVRESILRRTTLLMKLGAGHLSLNRESPSLSGGEGQRIRLANQAASGLRNVLYILDEPSAGLHPSEHGNLLEVMRSLVITGNTVLLVDHAEQSIREADWIIDVGPGAGVAGGQIIYNGPAAEFFNQPHPESITWQFLKKTEDGRREDQKTEDQKTEDGRQKDKIEEKIDTRNPTPETRHPTPHTRNPTSDTRNPTPDTHFLVHALNVITGVSGSGKKRLVDFILENTLRQNIGGTEIFRKVIHIDSSPIGRTPKSNPATYTGLSDHVRDLLASLPESHQRGYKKGQFSFVVKGGRCESCGGAGVQQIGMHFLGNVEVVCEVCEGKRFTDETLEIRYKGLNIYNILDLTVDEANQFFSGQKKITAITEILSDLGLGYLKLGQPSTTLSGGEAQRVKLATELSRQATGQTLYILDEPTTGLHMADVVVLLKALKKLIGKGHTLLCIEHDPSFILQSDWMVDLGPGSAGEGGNLVVEGTVRELINHPVSLTASELRKYLSRDGSATRTINLPCPEAIIEAPITLNGVETNNLKNIDIAFPVDAITAVTGVSGSGKSSLVYGTLYAESQRRFLEGTSSYNRQFAAKAGTPVIRESKGLVPAISLQKKNPVKNPRSTISTYTGLYDLYRLMFSRMAKSKDNGIRPLSTSFSFNSEEGACPVCKGLGTLILCDPDRLVTFPEKPLIAGALDGSKTGRFYGDPYGQYVAALITVGAANGFDYSVPFEDLDENARKVALRGCGDQIFDVEWRYKRGAHEGVHQLKTTWPGFLNLVETEYIRKHADARGDAMLDLMKNSECDNCHGFRLKPDILKFTIRDLHIGQINTLSADEAQQWFSHFFQCEFENEMEKQIALAFQENITGRLEALQKAGLGYISTGRIVGTLSGGEFQRLQLAGLVRAPLTGVAYILDEPSFGLHPKDTLRIMDLILTLNRHGNTIIMVDHSPLLIGKSDFLIELGPGAGSQGGEVVYAGKTEDRRQETEDRRQETEDRRQKTEDWRRKTGDRRQETEDRRLKTEDWRLKTADWRLKTADWELKTADWVGLRIEGANANNLKHIDLEIAQGVMTVITGVSGSGKTSLLDKVIFDSYSAGRAVACQAISGFENFNNLIYIEQPLPGKGYTATAASMLGISDIIYRIFPGSRDGQCPECKGSGLNQVSMDFFTDVVSPCEHCDGTGFRNEILEIRIDGVNIYEALQTPFDQLSLFLDSNLQGKSRQQVNSIFELIAKTGLGHLAGGRPLKTLSTGELQRMKLVSGLSGKTGSNTLFLLDEPTGGLHPNDIERLVKLFNELVEAGNTIVCVTHEPILMRAASRAVELGPGGGINGGRIIPVTV